MKRIMVAVDGPAGSGKSSVSKRVALDRGLKYIDSGALYRSITWYVLERDGAKSGVFVFTDDIAGLDLAQEFLAD
jgi:cytidylate kinase